MININKLRIKEFLLVVYFHIVLKVSHILLVVSNNINFCLAFKPSFFRLSRYFSVVTIFFVVTLR